MREDLKILKSQTYRYSGQYAEYADWMLEQHDAGISYAEIGRRLVGRGKNNAYGDQVSGSVVASVIKAKLRERVALAGRL